MGEMDGWMAGWTATVPFIWTWFLPLALDFSPSFSHSMYSALSIVFGNVSFSFAVCFPLSSSVSQPL